jgi:hypothetical protein
VEDDDVEELVEEQDEVEDVSDSESSSSEVGVAFRFKDGNTRPGISNEGL